MLQFLIGAGSTRAAAADERFAVYYSDQASAEDFAPYHLIILDSEHHPLIQPLLDQGKNILGYISLGEVKETDPYFARLKQENMVLAENPNWKGSHAIDLRNPLWTKKVIEDLIPPLLREGFNGVFFDTLDNSINLEDTDPQKFKGMRDGVVRLLETVRMHYPNIVIMVNRAYPLLPRIAPLIDKELGESVYADYNFETKKYGKVDSDTYNQQLKWLKDARAKNPKLEIYTLDYADPDNSSAIADIYKTERNNGFIPYVATVELDRLVSEPGKQ